MKLNEITAKIKDVPAYVKGHWNTTNEGEYLTLKETAAYTVTLGGAYVYQSIAGLITFSASYFCGSIIGLANLDFSIISIISTVVGYVFMFLNPIHMLIYENHGVLTKKMKIFAHISFIAEFVIGLACYFIPQNQFEFIINGLPQLVGNMLVVGGVTAYLNWGIHRFFSAKHGRYKPFVLICGLPSALMLSAIPYLPLENMSYTNKLIILHFAFTLFSWFFNNSIYVNSMVTFITPNSQERQKLLSIVPIFSGFLSSIVGIFLPMLITVTGGYENIKTYKVFVPIISISGALLMYAMAFCKERVIEASIEKRKKVKFWKGAKNALKNKYLWINNISGLLGAWQWLVGSLLSWWFVYSLRMEWLSGVAANIVVVGMTLGNIICPMLTKKYEKRNILLSVRAIGLMILFLVVFAVKIENIIIFIAAMMLQNTIQPIINGVGSGLGADIQDYHQWKYGERCDSVAGVFSWFTGPIGTAIGYIMPWILAQVGFTSDWGVLYDSTILNSVFNIYTWGTVLGVIFATLPFVFYDLTREKHDICIKELQERLALEESSAENAEAAAQEV